MREDILIRGYTPQDKEVVIGLMQRQDERLYQLDDRLRRPRSTDTLRAFLSKKVTPDTIVAVDEKGEIQGMAIPGLWEISADSEMLGFFFPRNGTVALTLPHPDRPNALLAAQALLEAIEQWWKARSVDGTLITWPSADRWLEELLNQRDYMADSAAALRPLEPIMPQPEKARLIIRQAEPKDEEILVALHIEEVRFHEAHTPYTRLAPGIEPAFRQRLARTWRGERVEDGALLLLVAEQAGEVVGFTENWLSTMEGGWFAAGRYGYLNSVGVTDGVRGHGIGRLLVAHTLNALAQYDIAGFYLYYIFPNPISSYFWPKMGFNPLLTTYKNSF